MICLGLALTTVVFKTVNIISSKSDRPVDITVECLNEFLEFVKNKSIHEGFINDL